MRGADVHLFYKVVLSLLHARYALAAAVLRFVCAYRHSLDVAAVRVGNYVLLYRYQVFYVYFAAYVFNPRAALVAEFVLYRFYFLYHDVQYARVVRQYVLVVRYLYLQLFQFVDYLLPLQTRQPAQRHVRYVVGLHFAQLEAVAKPLLALGYVLRGLHYLDNFVDVVQRYR